MASNPDNLSMALFCDFENVALGVRDAKYDKFDIKPVLERLLLKGSIVVKKAYCDWERYRGFKAAMHEANFELIEIPHVRQSGKNSADIRLVVDALDLCYTKSHVNTFVIISGDSDFSPLVSKLRENAKTVIGVGVKDSTSDLLVANCDEFIFYDELVHDRRRAASTRADAREAAPGPRRGSDEERGRREEMERRRLQGVEIAYETFEALMAERGDSGKIWASVLKEAIKRRNPGFSEGAYGFRTFGNLLEEAQALRLLGFGRDEKSGAYVFRGAGVVPAAPASAPTASGDDGGALTAPEAQGEGGRDAAAEPSAPSASSRRRGGRRGHAEGGDEATRTPPPEAEAMTPADEPAPAEAPARRSYFDQAPARAEAAPAPESVEPVEAPAPDADAQPAAAPRPARKTARKTTARKAAAEPAARSGARSAPESADAGAAKPAAKAAAKTPRTRKKAADATPGSEGN